MQSSTLTQKDSLLKKSWYPLICLIAGLAIGIIYEKKKCTCNEDDITFIDGHGLLKESTKVDSATAQKFMENFDKHNRRLLGGRLRTEDGNDYLRGFYINRGALDKILGQTGCSGVRVFLGKHVDDSKRAYTLVFMGTTPRPRSHPRSLINPADTGDLNMNGEKDFIYDYVEPCPNNCGGK